MKVYVLTSGAYSDYEIREVTLDKDIAEALKEMNSNNPDYSWRIEEYDLFEDKGVIERLKTKKKYWYFSFCKNGDTAESYYAYYNDDNDDTIKYFYERGLIKGTFEGDPLHDFSVVVLEEDHDKALKIARDKRAKAYAEKYGLT